MAERYNGWTNYETWCVSLWLDSEQGSQEYWRAEAQRAWDDTEGKADRKGLATRLLAGQLKEDHEEAMPEVEGMFADLLGAAMSEVSWDEIAKQYVDDVDKGEAGG